MKGRISNADMRMGLVVSLLFVVAFGLSVCFSACGEGENMGTLYTLQEAYDEGLLTVEDLQSIAHYQSAGRDEPDITPQPKSPESLSEEALKAIKITYLTNLRAEVNYDGKPMYPKAKLKDITVGAYYGTYRGAIAVKISDAYSGSAAVIVELVVAGVTFTYSGVPVTVWKAF